MIYNDYKFATEQEYGIMKKTYSQSLSNKNNDLIEISQKMQEQRDFLRNQPKSQNFESILKKLDICIKELDRIVSSNEREIGKLLGKSARTLDNGNVISPIRHIDEISASINPPSEDLLNDNKESNTIDIDTSPTSPTKPIQSKRHCPQQGSSIFNAFRQIDVGLGKLFGFKKSFAPTSLNKNKPLPHECQPNEIIKHNQIDIVSLLLLYMMINPNCRFLPTICNITNAQYDILLQVF